MMNTKNWNCKTDTISINALSDYIQSTSNHMGTTTNATESWDEKMRNHITPISAYIELILEGKMGEISESQRTKLELIRTEVEKMTELLKIAKEETVPKNSSNNETSELELKLELLETELKRNTKQIQQLEKEKTDSANLEKELTKRDVNAISTEIAKIHRTLKGKNHKILTVIAVTALITLVGTNLIPDESIFKNSNNEIPLTSKYVIENLRGDKVDTDKYWKIAPNEPLQVKILKPANISKEKLELVKNAIFSDEIYDIPDSWIGKGPKGEKSKYYLGWAQALSTIEDAKLVVPKNFEILTDSDRGEGDITITLTNLEDSDGISGLTKNIVTGEQILKSEITIYDTGNLSDNQLLSTVRHEFGHAMGLAHSTAKEDLMFPIIQTAYPYISDCTLGAILHLYDENKQSQYTCEK